MRGFFWPKDFPRFSAPTNCGQIIFVHKNFTTPIQTWYEKIAQLLGNRLVKTARRTAERNKRSSHSKKTQNGIFFFFFFFFPKRTTIFWLFSTHLLNPWFEIMNHPVHGGMLFVRARWHPQRTSWDFALYEVGWNNHFLVRRSKNCFVCDLLSRTRSSSATAPQHRGLQVTLRNTGPFVKSFRELQEESLSGKWAVEILIDHIS